MTGKTVVPAEAVEAAAHSLYKGQPIYDEEAGVITGHKPWEWMEPQYQAAMLEETRAALEAAAPFIAAEALEDAADEWSDWDALQAPEDWLRARAAAVRGEG